MGIQDMLAVLFGVKTAEVLEERREAKENRGWSLREVQAEVAAQQSAVEALTPAWESQVQPLLDRIPANRRFEAKWFGYIQLPSLYSAYLAQGSYEAYVNGLSWSDKKSEQFESHYSGMIVPLLASIQAADPGLFDEIVDAYLGAPEALYGENIQNIRRALGLRPLGRLPATKACPRCAEMVKRQAQVCRYCGGEFA